MIFRYFSIYIILLACCVTGCSTATDRSPYPLSTSPAQAPIQRRDFVDSFLQGYWCEAEIQYTKSLESSLRSDDFCAAAKTAKLAARLRAYLDMDAGVLEQEARRYAKAALDCPGSLEQRTQRDKDYETLIEERNYLRLERSLKAEKDSLFASVYARKAARTAIAQGDDTTALTLIELARIRDARQGWVTFLREDWRLRLSIEDNPQTRQAINDRIRILDDQIFPCD